MIHITPYVYRILDSIGTIPGIPSEMVARDAVDCFLELFELEGISLLPEIPSAGINTIVPWRCDPSLPYFFI
jgi:hypothetical protein